MMCDSVSAYLLGFFVYKGKRDNVLTGQEDIMIKGLPQSGDEIAKNGLLYKKRLPSVCG